MITIDGENHLYFASNAPESFMNDIVDQLVPSGSITGATVFMSSLILSALMLA